MYIVDWLKCNLKISTIFQVSNEEMNWTVIYQRNNSWSDSNIDSNINHNAAVVPPL